MDIKRQILEQLASKEGGFAGSLAYGIKLWNSPSFYYMSKYEVLFQYFLDNVTTFFEELNSLDETQFNERWQIVNTFLLLPCPSNALSTTMVEGLERRFRVLCQQAVGRKEQLLESLLIVACDVKYKNFYKFDFYAYAAVLGVAIDYYKKCLNERRSKEEEEKIVDRIFGDIKIYHKSASDSGKWRLAFDQFVTPLSELVLLLETRGIERRTELLDFFQQVYFTHDRVSTYNRTVQGGQKSSAFMGHFDPSTYPLHVIALLMEGFLRSYRDLKLEILFFMRHYLQNVFVVENSIVPDSRQMFAITKYVFTLLKRYYITVDQQLMVDFNFIDILITELKQHLTAYSASDPLLGDCLELIRAINEYNPLILEHSIVDIVLQVMFMRKHPETLHSFQAMLVSTVNMFMKLNKGENLCDELFMKLGDYLDEQDLDERIRELRTVKLVEKRRLDEDCGETPSKKKKRADGSEQPAREQLPSGKKLYWDALFSDQNTSNETGRMQHHSEVYNFWPELTFAWPDADGRLGEAMKEYTKQLLTKRSLSYWKKFMLMLNDLMELPDQTESIVLQVELVLCWMCYFFAGNTLIEQSNLFWSRLVASLEEFDQILGNIGRKVLAGEDEAAERTSLYGAFLNVVYYYGNYRTMVLYYRPDSIEENDYKKLYAYLSDAEWRLVEERVPAPYRPLLNRVLLQKLRLSFFDEQNQPTEAEQTEDNREERQRIIAKVLEDKTGEHVRPLLLDRATNVWFMGLLAKQQQRTVANWLLDAAYCPLEEINYILLEVTSNHDLLEVFLVEVYRKIAKLLARSEDASMLRNLNFKQLLEQEETTIVPKLKQLLEQSATTNRGEEQIVLNPPTVNGLMHLLDVLDEIRIDLYEQDKKSILVAVHLLLLAKLNSCSPANLAERFKNQLIKFILLGTTTNVAKFITVETLVKLFGLSPVVISLLQQIVEHLTEEKFEEFKSILNNFSNENDAHFELLLLIYNLEQRNKSRNRKASVAVEQRKAFLGELVSAVDGYLLQKNAKKLRKHDPVRFNHALKGCFTSVRHKAEGQQGALSEELREHLLGFIKQALKVFSYNSDMLLTRCLIHKDFLKLDASLTTAIEQKCWETFIALMQEKVAVRDDREHGLALDEQNPAVSQTDEQMRRIETIISALVGHLSEGQYMEKLNLLNRIDVVGSKDSTAPLKLTMAVFDILSKKGLTNTVSKETCKVFVRSFAAVVARDVMGLCVLNQHQRDHPLLETILECFATIVAHRKLALFPALLDYVLQFMSAINIRKHASVQQGEEAPFFRLHRLMSEVLFQLLKARPNYVVTRLPSYMHVYEALVGALICYKGDVGMGKALNSFEILTISDLLLPLQRIVNIACKKLEKQLYTLAPYVLGKVLDTIVQCKRSTTEHNRIASNVYNICFSLMGIYDTHAPAYLLRTLDESCRALFTTVTKRYERRNDNLGYRSRGKSA